jgi:hypothetical protein
LLSSGTLLFQLGVLEKGLQCSGRDGAAVVVVGHTIGKVDTSYTMLVKLLFFHPPLMTLIV